MASLRRITPGIRGRVLLASSALLLVPWIGYTFVAEMVRFLDDGQARMLADSARAVAALVQERAKVVAPAGASTDLAPALTRPIELDGSIDADWIAQGARVRFYGAEALAEARGAWTPRSLSFSHALGRYGDDYYAFFEVSDDRLIYCTGEAASGCDAVRVSVKRAGGEPERYVLTAARPGPLRLSAGDTQLSAAGAPRIEGVLQERERGYVVELRLPAAGVERLAFAVADVDDPESGAVDAVIVTEDRSAAQPRSALAVSDDVAAVIDAMARANLRIWLVDRNAVVVRRTGSITPPAPTETATAVVRRAIEPLLALFGRAAPRAFADPLAQATRVDTFEVASAITGTPASRVHKRGSGLLRINAAAHPIEIGGEIVGAALVEQSTEAISQMREIALERLLVATLGAFVFGALILLFYVSRVSMRLRKLRDEAEHAIDSAGRVQGLVVGSDAGDEIGDLSRSYSAVLRRLAQYTDYLENLARRLNHELRTPIAVVRSSLDNLRSDPERGAVYIERAESGLERLSAILSRMSEATRLEDIMRRSERETFDLAAVVSGCVDGYRVAYAPREIRYGGPDRRLRVSVVPDLDAQLHEKLVAYAAEHAKPGTPIDVTLAEDGTELVLRVSNEGPPLPAEMEGRLFDSMVSVPRGSGAPHLGLGLYIVKLIARFHHGAATAANRTDTTGVEVSVKIARYVSDPA
jgi:dedicated sortase system histidine kinase